MPVAGPFYFAQISDGTTAFDSGTHNVMDFYIFSFNLQQAETEFASLEIEIKNPGVAALLAGPLWCWFSYDGGGGPAAIFKGRMVAIPTNVMATVITLKYVARPDDYEAQRAALAQTIRDTGRPFWDPIFIDDQHQTDPDAALEAIAQDWHTDRMSLVVSTSDILLGEDGTVTFNLGEALLDDLDVQIGEAPIQSIDVEATVPWKQNFGGEIDFGFWGWAGPATENVIQAWPKTGDQLAGGYSVTLGFAKMIVLDYSRQTVSYQVSYQNEAKTHRDGDTMSLQASFSGTLDGRQGDSVILKSTSVPSDPYTGTPAHAEIEEAGVFPERQASLSGQTALKLGYGMDRARTEKIVFTVNSDIQEVLRPATDQATPEKISKSGKDVQEFIGSGAGAASYYMTERGNWSVEYLILLGVARLKLASRIVKVTWGTNFPRALELTCRKSAAIFDPRLQNGQAVGKITAYSIIGNGDSGEFKGNVTIGCA